MPGNLVGPKTWSCERDEDGHRTYTIRHLVRMDSVTEGPAEALRTPGLPVNGSSWAFDDDVDLWAWCLPTARVTPKVDDGEPNEYFEVEQQFSTRPQDRERCHDTPVEDPLLEPDRVSGTFTKYQEEAVFDRFGDPLKNSAHEQFRGPQVEFDANRPVVRVEQTVADLQLSLLAQLIDTLNDSTLWGFPARRVKLSNVSWEKKYYGPCYVYYTRTLEFEVRYNGWDRCLLDEGTKVLNGHWSPSTGAWNVDDVGGQSANASNPAHFIRFTDRNGNPARVVLDGSGLPADVSIGFGTATATVAGEGPGQLCFEYYGEGNFLLLGIPLIF